jgi:WD40 repeat protein
VPLADAAPDAGTRRLVEALVGARILLLTTERGGPAIRLAHVQAIERWPRAREIVAGKSGLAGARRARRTSAWRWAPAAMATAALVLLAVLAGWQFFVARSAQQAERAAIIARDRALEQRQLADAQRRAADEQSRIAQQRESAAEAQRVAAQQQEQAAEDELAIARRRQEEAERARQAADDRRDQALSAQSRVLADLAERKRREGDVVTAALLAMEALPDAASGIVRPLVSEAKLSLERAWRAPQGERPREVSLLSGHTDAVRACVLSRDGARAVTGGTDATVRVWDARAGALLAALQGHADAVNFVAFSANGSRIVTAADDGVRVWDAGSRAQIALLPEKRTLIAVSDDGRGVISVAAGNRLQIWDATTGQETSKTLGPILATRFGADGPRVLVAGGDNSIELYDAASGRRLRVFRGHWRKPLNAVFSPDGQRIASIGDDQTARIWSVADGRGLFLLSDAKLSRDSAIQLVADRALIPFDAGWRMDGARRLADVAANDGKAARALFSPSGKFVVSFAEGFAPKLWDATTGKELAALAQPGQAGCAAISQDERQLLIGGGNGVADLWSFDADADQLSADRLEAMLEFSKTHAPRCLTAAQREQAFLEPQPPAWCIELAKWPYDTPAWKDWLRFKRENAAPPLPNSSEWRPWLASRSTSEGQTTRDAEHDLPPK